MVHHCVAWSKVLKDEIMKSRHMRLLLTDRADHDVDPISSCLYFIPRQAMEKHRHFLKKHCRLCGKNLKRNGREYGKELFKGVLNEKVYVNISNDTTDVHPEKLCAACKAKLYRLSSLNEEDEAVVGIQNGLKVFNWKAHAEDGDCFCQSSIQRNLENLMKVGKIYIHVIVLNYKENADDLPKKLFYNFLTLYW